MYKRCTLAILLLAGAALAQRGTFENLRRRIEISEVQAKVEKAQQAFWREYFWKRDYNALVAAMNAYIELRERGNRIPYKLQRKIQKLHHRVFGVSKHCQKWCKGMEVP